MLRFHKFHSIRKYSIKTGEKLFITTPIYYVNAAPHLGHLYSSLIACAIHRFKKLVDPSTETIFSTGTDEHGTKILRAAENNKVPVKTYCDNISEKYLRLFETSNISFTDFVRTTDSRHKTAVQAFWNKLKSKGDITLSKYSGYYSVQDECFLTESQLKTNENNQKISLESGHLVEWTEETNYMFKLDKYRDDIIYWAKQENRITPRKFNKILLDMLNEELPDISVSRPSDRIPWGIPIPGDESQNCYVWLDALTNYLTCAGYPNNLKIWPPTVQVLGKDILKFHGIYWPAFLIAADLEPPRQLLVHSHWTVDGQKMSKSKGNVIDPIERSQLYTMEGIRYFLLREGVQHSDGNYSDTKIIRILNSELADTFGNLLSRACAKTLNPRQIFPQIHEKEFNDLLQLDATRGLIEKLTELSEKCFNHYQTYSFHLVADTVISALHSANNFFETTKPWELKKGNEEQIRRLETILSVAMEALRVTSIILNPIIPQMSERILNRLNVDVQKVKWTDTQLNWNESSRNLISLDSNVLFKRILLDEKQKQRA